MIILTKSLGHEKHKLLLTRHLIKVIFLNMWQTKHLVKNSRGPSRWPRLSQIGHA
jgi:hypothetical protein